MRIARHVAPRSSPTYRPTPRHCAAVRLRGRRIARTLIAVAVLWSAWPSRAAEIPFGARDLMTVVRPDVMTIVRADDALPVVVDGRLDEPIWQDLAAISDFVVI